VRERCDDVMTVTGTEGLISEVPQEAQSRAAVSSSVVLEYSIE